MHPERALLLALLLLLAAGCSGAAGPRPIEIGAPCASCGMEVRDLGFASEIVRAGAYRFYDSIECLLRDRPSSRDAVYLPDYDSRALHAADSLWIVKGRFPSPMGGGLAAFVSRAAAEDVALRTEGRVGAWSEAKDLLVSAP